jgi:serine protease Do
VPGGPADYAGLRRGDIIISFDGKAINNISDLPKIVADTNIGKTVETKIIRNGKN